jgi:predicted transposase YbfD/YdcC
MAGAQAVRWAEHFGQLPDPRRQTENRRHLLSDILVIALCGVISDCDSAVMLEEFGKQKEDFFRRFLELPHGIPSHDTFTRVLAALDPQKFGEAFVSWAAALHEATEGRTIPIDGKTLRRSFDKAGGLGPLHIVSAWAAENALVLGQVAVDGKSNEITAIPKLLELLDVSGAIVTIDAMGCQKEIAAQIRAQGADYVLAVKDNQPHLHEDLQQHFVQALEREQQLPRRQRHRTRERSRGRVEERYYYSTPVPPTLRNPDTWRDLESVGWVVSITEREGRTVTDVRAYISSLEPDAKQLARAVRQHWGIENRQHWVLDMTFREDECRTHAGHGAENFALLRRLAMNLLRTETTSKASLKVKRHAAGWNDDLLLQILTAGTT